MAADGVTAAGDLSALRDFVLAHPRLFVLTGAGCSTGSGIPDYRDSEGAWKRRPPMNFSTFMGSALARSRYWARGMIGWRMFGNVSPNAAHLALARMERQDRFSLLVTQNVDGLHEKAGSRDTVDLHGRMDRVICTQCGHTLPRTQMQEWLESLNPTWRDLAANDAPDGDADLEDLDFSSFQVPPCPVCGGILKPDVVFFGETVPRDRVARANDGLARADAVLVVGSSLMVYSGYRFVAAASRAALPIAAINLGRTRADSLLALKIEQPCAEALANLLSLLPEPGA
ncbi:NAD-dependent protein deacetylase [Bordetella bronchialis]|uniref:NAD-dependent protein deacetylase n=1 Tax=Bordetella bronchialis TaxID=463025 RepID=A0A193FG47_9BORD|nr:NAD-dependent protein deacetylase [Bordetella bronchialis]ANN66166.1 NAD-dependent deacetylase [Bordetella bronchialis]ANN71247.1 NAD-dependent deacetylase [Bordetella bronchialis]